MTMADYGEPRSQEDRYLAETEQIKANIEHTRALTRLLNAQAAELEQARQR